MVSGRKQSRAEKEQILATASVKLSPADKPKIVSVMIYTWKEPVLGTMQLADDNDDVFVFTSLNDPGFVVSFSAAQVETIYHENGVLGAV